MPLEIDDLGVRIIGNNLRLLQFYDDSRTLQQEIYLQGDNTLNIGSTSTGGGGGSTDVHALDGGLHVGTLANAQAPQFLLLSGTREMGGDLDMGGNAITDVGNVDGVDVSAHASRHELAGADAVNHDSLTGFVADEHIAHTGVTLTAGDGLTGGGTIAASRTFAVGAGDGIDVAADSVAVDVTDFIDTNYGLTEDTNNIRIELVAAWSGLEFSGGDLRVDLDAAYTWAGTHDFDASVTVTNGADFTVGANIFFVDASGTNVGINCAPDAQFALDVNGPIRGTYLIGELARLLPNMLLLCHFDGQFPYATDFSGEPRGHLGQVPVITWGGTAGDGLFRAGKFYKAIQVAEATTNLLYNYDMSGTYTGGLAVSLTETDAGATITPTQNTDPRYIEVGASSQKLIFAGSGTDYIAFAHATMANATQYTWSLRFYLASGAVSVIVWYGDTSYTETFSALGWNTFSYTQTSTAAGSSFTYLIYSTVVQGGATVYVDQGQIEQKAYRTPLCGGDMGSGHSWASTARASTSARTAAVLGYDSPLLLLTTGEAWVHLVWIPTIAHDSFPASSFYLFSDGGFAAWYDGTDDKIYFSDDTNTASTSALAFDAGDYVTLDFVASSAGLAIYVDGVADGTNGTFTAPAWGATLNIGSASGGGDECNGLIDELAVVSVAPDADLVRAVYESDAPVFAETARPTFRTWGACPVWADDEGLYARDASGNAILGLSSVDTKSWGGATLDAGDLLIGRIAASMAWEKWDASAGTLTFGVSSATNVTIDASGNVTLGNVAANQGNAFWNNTNKRLEFRGGAGGTVVGAYVDTTGAITAGGGTVTLSSDGVAISAYDGVSPPSQNLLRFLRGASQTASLYSYWVGNGDDSYTTILEQESIASSHSYLRLLSTAPGSYTADVVLVAENGDGSANLVLVAGSAPHFYTSYDARIGGGLYVGGIATDPDADDVYIDDNCSALSFTDRTPFFAGDALAQLREIRGDEQGRIDHKTLPPQARKTIHLVRDGQDVYEEGRDLGAMVSLLTVGMQQLAERVEQLEER